MNQPKDPWNWGDTRTTAAQGLVTDLLAQIGEDPSREGLRDTPKRVVKSWRELFGGYGQDPAVILGTTFEKGKYDEMILVKDIEMFSTCEHHMLPFFGKAHVAYIPGLSGRVVGLSKVARLVEVFARRLQIQERLTIEIANALAENISPKGVGVMIEAKHFCMVARGIQKQNSTMVTSHLLGCFRENEACRNEFISGVR